MLWTLLSIAAAFSELIAFLSADWLVGFPRVPDSAPEASTEAYRPTLGLFGRCAFVGRVMCGPYALTFNEIASGFWKAAAIFLATGILLLSAVAFTSIFTICFQSIMRKSIFNVCGLLQGIAGTQTNTYTNAAAVREVLFMHSPVYLLYTWGIKSSVNQRQFRVVHWVQCQPVKCSVMFRKMVMSCPKVKSIFMHEVFMAYSERSQVMELVKSIFWIRHEFRLLKSPACRSCLSFPDFSVKAVRDRHCTPNANDRQTVRQFYKLYCKEGDVTPDLPAV